MILDKSDVRGPLFGEIDERFARDDEWSFPKSISIGWPVQTTDVATFRDYSTRYYRASQSICAMIKNNDVEDYVVSFPVIYLVRHSIELGLKGAILSQTGKAPFGHELNKLWPRVQGLSDWALNWIREFHDLDTKSDALRYPDSNVTSFEVGALLDDWETKTEKLHGHLMMLCQDQQTIGNTPHAK